MSWKELGYKTPASCHPDRPVHGHGLCLTCYRRDRRHKGLDKRPKCSETTRRHGLKSKYGVTPEWYIEKLQKQGGGCAICGRTDPGDSVKKYLCVDHNHTTKKVRGVLCGRCNRGIGMFQDSLPNLRRAIAYLEEYK